MFFIPGDRYETTFWMCAVAGTLLFILKSLLMLFSGGDDLDHPGHDGHGSDIAFKLFSVHSLTGFFMMFGWSGLAFYSEFELGALISFVLAFAAGLGTMVLTGLLFRGVSKFASEGAQFSVDDTVGKTGNVYQRIPANGRGRIQITVNGSLREIDAVSDALVDIDSFQTVEVVRAVDGRTVSVRRVG